MNYRHWRNCAPGDRRINTSTLLLSALSRLVQNADTNWAADSASFEYHLKCKKECLRHRKLQAHEKVLPVAESLAAVLSVQDTIPESHLAKYGNFTYSSEDAIFKKFNQSENEKGSVEKELPMSSESVALEPWQEDLVSKIFRKLLGTDDPGNSIKATFECEASKSEIKSRMALEVTHPTSKGEAKGNSSSDSFWPTSGRDSCPLCKQSLSCLSDYFPLLRKETNIQGSGNVQNDTITIEVWPYISEEEVLLAPSPVMNLAGKCRFNKLLGCLATPYVRSLWPPCENKLIAKAKTWAVSQKLKDATNKMQRRKHQCSLVSSSMSSSDDETYSDHDNGTAEYTGYSNPSLERCIIAKSKELLRLVDEETGSRLASKWQSHSCSSRREIPYWEYINPERICNQQDSSSRVQTYAEVCRTKAVRALDASSHNVFKKSKSQSNLLVSTGSRQIKSTYSHDHLTPMKLLTPVQTKDPWPAIAASANIKNRKDEVMQLLTPLAKKNKRIGTRNDLSQRSAASSSPNQHSPATVPSSFVRPRPITGYRNRDCFESQKPPDSNTHHYHAPEAVSHQANSGIEGVSHSKGVHQPKSGHDPTSTSYKRYHWHAPSEANKRLTCHTYERSFDYEAKHQENHNLDYGPGEMAMDDKYHKNQWPTLEPMTSFNYGASRVENHTSRNNKFFWAGAAETNTSAEKNAHFQNSKAVALLSSTHAMEDPNANHPENSFADGKQQPEDSQYPYFWISGQFLNPWNFHNIACQIQYPMDSFLTSAPVVQVLEVQHFRAEKAIQRSGTNNFSFAFPPMTSSFSSYHWMNHGTNIQASCPTNAPLAANKGNADGSDADSPGADATKNALCLPSAPQTVPKLHQRKPHTPPKLHQRKPRNLQNLIRVIGVQMQESVLALSVNSSEETQKSSPRDASNYGNAVVLPSDRCQASVANQEEDAPSLSLEESVTDANTKKLKRGLGILTKED